MRRISCNLLLAVGLILALGWVSETFADKKDRKRPRNAGILSVQVTFEKSARPEAYRVLVDGDEIGLAGNRTPREFYLSPGIHTVEIIGPDNQIFEKEVEIIKGEKNCICLVVRDKTKKTPCPYDVRVEVVKRAEREGDIVVFRAVNAVSASVPLTYRWTITPSQALVIGEAGREEIEVDTTGLGGQQITAYLDVTDKIYGETCQQKNSASFTPEKTIIRPPEPARCVVFETTSFDDDKYHFDNCVVALRNRPDAKLYINIYQGTDRFSRRRTADLVRRRTLDYLVNARGVDARSIQILMRGTRPRTTVEIWIVPPGAELPVPND
ncbi:MAG TPA: hypothetical protein VGB00_09350 [Pyrinomonadaceae bacterium]|jgi:hypothetical protein